MLETVVLSVVILAQTPAGDLAPETPLEAAPVVTEVTPDSAPPEEILVSEDATVPVKPFELESVPEAASYLTMLDQLLDSGFIDTETAGSVEQYLVAEASAIAGEELTRGDIRTWRAREGVNLIAMIFWILGGLLVVAGIAYIFHPIWIALAMFTPKVFWEAGLYAASLFLLFFQGTLFEIFSGNLFWWVIGSLGFGGTLMLSFALHGANDRNSRRFQWSVISGLCTLVWAFAAMSHGSMWLGFMAVIAAESFLGFSVIASGLCYTIGFTDENSMVRTTFASFVLLAAGLGIRQFGLVDSAPVLAVFESGLLFMGSFVGFLGLLIISSRWYLEYCHRLDAPRFLFMNLLMLAVLIGAIYYGEATDVSVLRGMAVTFLVFWALDKSAELSYWTRSVGWGMLIGGSSLATAGWFCVANTELLLFTLSN